MSAYGAEPTLNSSHIVAEFRKPDGSLVYLQKDNANVYLAKGFTLTGVEFSWDDWNVYAAGVDKWRAVGGDQSAANPPLFPGPVLEAEEPPPTPVGAAPTLQPEAKLLPPTLQGGTVVA